jgi:hypothetical protein
MNQINTFLQKSCGVTHTRIKSSLLVDDAHQSYCDFYILYIVYTALAVAGTKKMQCNVHQLLPRPAMFHLADTSIGIFKNNIRGTSKKRFTTPIFFHCGDCC